MEKGEKYDWLIIGAGVSGSVFAREMANMGKKCVVVEKANNVGGMCLCENINGVDVHKYGAHIFHTNSQKAWDYFLKYAYDVRRLGIYTVQALSGGVIYPLPFNMNTFTKMWDDVRTPHEAKERIKEQAERYGADGDSLKDYAISQVGTDIFEKLIKGYTEKQWGALCEKLPKEIIGRIPVRFTFDNNYYYCDKIGIPRKGYNEFFQNLLKGVEVIQNCQLNSESEILENAKNIYCTAPIDCFFNYRFGALNYRGLEFEIRTLDKTQSQGCPVVNYCDHSVKYTRKIEHNQFTDKDVSSVIMVSYEYPKRYRIGDEPYYPIPTKENIEKYNRYVEESNREFGGKIIWGGRLGRYKYIAMDEAILGALEDVERAKQRDI